MTTTTIVLFTRDLRVHDHPALSAAAEAGEVVPLFVDWLVDGDLASNAGNWQWVAGPATRRAGEPP